MEQVLPDQKGLGNKMEGKKYKDDHLSKKIDYKRKQRWNDRMRSGIQEIFWERETWIFEVKKEGSRRFCLEKEVQKESTLWKCNRESRRG